VTASRTYGAGRWGVVSIALVVLAGSAVTPYAGAGISNPVFTIEARNYAETQSATYSVAYDVGCWDPIAQTYEWSLPAPYQLTEDSTLIATLVSANVTIQVSPTPMIDMNIEVVAEDDHAKFFADSALLDFATIPAAEAEGSFSVVLSVFDDGGDGYFMAQGLSWAGAGVGQSYYNGAKPGGTLFSHLVGGASGANYAIVPDSYEGPIDTDVYDMRVHDAFVLTQGDRASVETTYGIVPEPAGLMLLALGGALLQGRRRGT
jgi:hypothetical protein